MNQHLENLKAALAQGAQPNFFGLNVQGLKEDQYSEANIGLDQIRMSTDLAGLDIIAREQEEGFSMFVVSNEDFQGRDLITDIAPLKLASLIGQVWGIMEEDHLAFGQVTDVSAVTLEIMTPEGMIMSQIMNIQTNSTARTLISRKLLGEMFVLVEGEFITMDTFLGL